MAEADGSPPGTPRTDRVSDTTPDGTPTGQFPAVGGQEPVPRRPWWRRKQVVIGSAAAILAAGTGVGIWVGTSGDSSPSHGARTTTEIVPVSTGTMKQTVSAHGTIEPAQVSDLDFAVSGTVSAVDVAVGDMVTAGETLATVATTALAAEEAAAQAALTSATSTLASAEAQGASASQLASDEAAVVSAKDQLTTAKKALAAARLTSPIAGIVASVDLSAGDAVPGTGSGGSAGGGGGGAASAGSSGSTSAQVVVESADTFVVNTSVDDTEVSQVATGDQAVIVPTGAQKTVDGTVASVGKISTSSGGVPSFPVTIDVTGTPSGVYAGSGAQVSIVVKQLDDVVEVPSSAIAYDGGQASVTVVEPNGRRVRVPVSVGTTVNGETQIVHGVRAGEKIVDKVLTFTAPTGAKVGKGTGFRPPGGHVQRIVQTGVVQTGTGG